MIKLNRLLRRSAVRLLCLVAAILALSPSVCADAWGTPGLIGQGYNNATWNADQADYSNWSKDGEWYKKDVVANATTVMFKVRCYDGDNRVNYIYAVSGGNQNVTSGQEYSTTNSGSDAFVISNATNGKTYTIWFRVSDQKVKATWDNGGSSTTTSEYYIEGGFDGWSSKNYFKKSGNSYVVSISNWKNSNGFLIKKSNSEVYGNDDNGKKTPLQKGVPKQMYLNGGNTYLESSAEGKTITFTMTLNSNGKPYMLTCNWNDKLPVFPIGVYDKAGLDAYNEPTYYLLAYGLNNEKITPEYQFTKATAAEAERLRGLASNATNKSAIAEGKYVLELTMHNTTLRWSKGDGEWGDHPMSVVGFDNPRSSAATKISNFRWNELTYDPGNAGNVNDFLKGYACVAVYDASSNTLEIVKKNDGLLPFISLVGANWKQNTVANNDTPYTLPSRDDGKTHTTDDGWQDAWIQYNDKGQIAKDIDGNVMFNTMFPPRNVIKFATDFRLNGKDYNFTLGSDELVILPTGQTKSGYDWKNNPPAEIAINGITGTKLTSNGSLALGDAVDFQNQLALDDNERYTLYEVSNVWVNGKFKFWTGWTGGANNSDGAGANWANHANWGHYKEQKSDDKQTVADNTTAQQIHMNATVPLGDTDGDMIFAQPTYFKKLYFFYNAASGIVDQKSVFMMLPARLGAQIAALSRENYTRGMYQPALKDLGDLGNLKVLDVVITAHNYDSEEHELVTTVRLPENIAGLNKTASTFGEIFSGMEGETGGWVYDPYAYNNGNYYYNMVVTFENPSAPGGKEAVEVRSNPFTIFRGEATASLKAYQLVKILGEHEDNVNYYYTFDPVALEKDENGNARKPETVYKVKVGVKGQNVSTGDTDTWEGNPIQSDLMPKYVGHEEVADASGIDFGDGSKYRFSCKVLLVGTIEGQNITTYELTNATKESITGDYVEKDNDPVLTADKHRFYFVVEPVIKDNGFAYEYLWAPEFKYSFTDAQGNVQTKEDGKSDASVAGCLVIPEPKLIEEHSRLEMFYGDDDSSNTDNDTRSFSYSVSGDNAVELGAGARFQQVRKAIVIERPNVTMRFHALAKDYITSKTPDSGIAEGSTKAPLVVGLFDFKVGDETVVINNGSKYSNDEGLDWYLYHSASKQPAYFYFKASDQKDYSWNPADNIGVDYENAYEPKTMTCTVRDAFSDVSFYSRWKDGEIAGLRISQAAPVNALADGTYGDAVKNGSSKGDNAVRIVRSSLVYDTNDDLIESVTVRINLASETVNRAARVNEEGKPLTEDGKVDETFSKAGKAMQYTGYSGETASAESAAGGSDYFLLRAVSKSTGADLVSPQAVSAKEMNDSKDVELSVNHGHWWNGQLEYVGANRLYKDLEIRVSHLYPFVYGVGGTKVDVETQSPAPRRVGESEAGAGDVIKSDAMTREFAEDIPTDVIGVEDVMHDSIVAGTGFIEAHGDGVEIYGADGIRVASGEGRHEVPSGVYVVRLNGRAEKVIVR